jgi:hypothetical protein
MHPAKRGFPALGASPHSMCDDIRDILRRLRRKQQLPRYVQYYFLSFGSRGSSLIFCSQHLTRGNPLEGSELHLKLAPYSPLQTRLDSVGPISFCILDLLIPGVMFVDVTFFDMMHRQHPSEWPIHIYLDNGAVMER